MFNTGDKVYSDRYGFGVVKSVAVSKVTKTILLVRFNNDNVRWYDHDTEELVKVESLSKGMLESLREYEKTKNI